MPIICHTWYCSQCEFFPDDCDVPKGNPDHDATGCPDFIEKEDDL